MTAAWLLLILALILLILGFIGLKLLFWIAAIVFAVWVVGWLVGAAGSDRRWYYW